MTGELERISKEAIGVYSRNYPDIGLEGPGKITENHAELWVSRPGIEPVTFRKQTDASSLELHISVSTL
jgi:hypothetical protein